MADIPVQLHDEVVHRTGTNYGARPTFVKVLAYNHTTRDYEIN